MSEMENIIDSLFSGNLLIITISKKEAEDGCVKYGVCKVKAPCEDCNGTGDKDKSDTPVCQYCQGCGQITKTKNVLSATFKRTKKCNHCKGAGRMIQNPCAACNGTGKTEQLMDVQIPAGTEDHDRIYLNTSDTVGSEIRIVVNIK